MLFALLCTLAHAGSAAPVWDPPDKQVETFNIGVTAFNEHHWDRAITAFRGVVNAEPSCGRALLMLGLAEAGRGDNPAALETFQKVDRIFPGRDDVLVQVAHALFVAQRFDEASVAAHAALKIAPGSSEALTVDIEIDVRLNRTETALATLDALAATPGQHDPGSIACERIFVLQNAHREAEARALLEACRTSPIPGQVTQAESRLADPLGVAEAAQALGAGNLSESLRAAVLQEAHKYAEAAALFGKVLDENPDDTIARVNLAICLYRLHRGAEAQAELRRLFSAGAWIRREESGSVSGIVTSRGAEELEAAMMKGLAVLLADLVDSGDLAGAREAQARAEERFGRTGPLRTTAAALQFASGTSGWSTLAPVLEGADATDRAWSIVGEQAFAHAADLPANVVSLLLDHGPDPVRFNLAAGRANADDAAGCLVAATALSDTSKPDYMRIGYGCAIRAGDDKVLAEWRERAKRAGGVTFQEASADAGRAADQREWAGIMLRLKLAAPAGDAEIGRANDLTVVALSGLGRLDDALELSVAPGVRPPTIYNLGVGLHNAGRAEEAEAVFRRACAGATQELKALCEEALK